MPLNSHKEIVDCYDAGRKRRYSWRKNPTQTTTAGLWFDLAMSPGSPPPKYWFDAPPLIAKAVSQSVDGGIFHGANVSPSEKYLRIVTALTATATALPLTLTFCDYLLYYPSIDDGTTDPQVLDNTVTLPRYADGAGVQVLGVSVAGRTGGQSFSFSYTNSAGVSGRTSQTVVQNASAAIGTAIGSAQATNNSTGPFIGLQAGDSGVRSIESVTMNGADVGLFALILVKPLVTFCLKEITAPYEFDALLQQQVMPQVYDDAFISAVCLPQGTLAATGLIGDLEVIWN